MQTLPLYQVDAFTNTRFCGNPAAIVPLESWLSDEMMQAIALENNLAETAYFVRRSDGGYDLRWFTPELEIPLCGHATLAAAFVLYEYLGFTEQILCFHTKSGELTVEQHNNKLMLNFPARPLVPLPQAENAALWAQITTAIGKKPLELFHSVNNYFAVYASEADVRSLTPDFMLLNKIEGVIGVIATAQGIAGGEYDCVSRYFCPNAGLPEDPVTGSAHCTIIPYWSQKLKKTTIRAYQASARGGELLCQFLPKTANGDRVTMAGNVVPYLKGEITV
jgi:PhzF family phenazine biosynthesis protein